MRRNTTIALAALPVAAVAILAPLSTARAQPDTRPAQPAGQAPAEPGQQPGAPGMADFAQILTAGLKSSKGCLGVDNARFASGKLSVVAWFENADALETWYYSDTHARMMGAVGADPEAREPLAHLDDRAAPIMVIASITLGGDKPLPGPMPISQISIEMFHAVPGGAAINGRLSPEGFKVPHFRQRTIGG